MASPSSTLSEPASRPVSQHVPYSLQVAAAWGWRLIVVGIIVTALATAFSTLSAILLPMIIALLIAAPLERLVTRMEALRIPRGLGAILAILGLVGVFVGLSVAAGASIVSGFEQLKEGAIAGFDQLVEWLSTGPLDLSRDQLDDSINDVVNQVQSNAWGVASGALSVTGVVGGVVAGIVIALISLFFFLRDGRQIWSWIAGLIPGEETSARVDRAGMGAWRTLRRYTQTSVFVAFVNGVGIGVVAWALGVPLAFPIGILAFVTSFLPLVGAFIAGVVATLIALVDGGWTTAALMLAGVLVVQQVEGNVLYPWLFGKATSIHPFAILLTISAGTLTAGLVGTVIAVPILAFSYTFVRGLRGEFARAEDVDDAEPITSRIPVVAKRGRDAIAHAISKTGEIRVRKDKDQAKRNPESSPGSDS